MNDKCCILEKLDARIPQWDMATLSARVCPFCGMEREPALIRPDGLPVAFCRDCGCWYVAQMPSPSQIRKLYDGYYRTHRPMDLSGDHVSRLLENAHASSRTDWRIRVLETLLGGMEGKRILDVGCGWGNFLLMARSAGAAVVGCDLSPEACEFAETKLGLCIHCSDLRSCSSQIGTFDAVVMMDLIEHSIDPLLDLQAACDVIRPGGLLFLLTPNGGEAGTDMESARKWVGFRVDLEHVQYLSPHTINRLWQRFGLITERLETSGFPSLKGIDRLPAERKRDPVHPIRNVLRRMPGARKAARVLRVIRTGTDQHCIDPRLGSYHLTAIGRKLHEPSYSTPV